MQLTTTVAASLPRDIQLRSVGDLMLLRVLLYINVLGGLSAVIVCALAPFADSIEKIISMARSYASQHSRARTVSRETVSAA